MVIKCTCLTRGMCSSINYLAICKFLSEEKSIDLLIMCSVEFSGSATKTRLSFLRLFFLLLQEWLNVLNSSYFNNGNLAS